MKVLIVAATAFEIAPFQKRWSETERPPGLDIHTLITGPGLLASSFALTRALLQEPQPQWVIQAGIAGSFSEKLAPGTVALVSQDRMGDTGVVENGAFRDIFQLGLLDPNQFPFREGALPNPHLGKLKQLGLPEAKAITVNEITTSTDRINTLRNTYGADLESMEGAALHYAALQLQLPFLQLRSVSNFVGERDKSKWTIDPAIHILNETLFRLLETLSA